MAKFFITTAIDYANSTPHLGTAFEKIGADVIARYRRMSGDDVFFLMGNDEHSQNVRRKAEEQGLSPKVYCDQMAEQFRATWKELLISNDFFIQTSSPSHAAVVREIAQRVFAARSPDGRPAIFKAPYEGHYCVSCEAFYQEKDLLNGLCPNHKSKPEWIREENYFFRLSAYSERLKKEIFAANPDFLRPVSRRNEILQVLEKGLEDISISRPNRGWGVPLPFDQTAVAYVWFDALVNYVSALGAIDGESYRRYWPADLHVIGKDITRFHCLIWPAMLMAAGLPPPKAVWAHGFVSLGGEKMSKSRGNVADPVELARQYGADTLRYHLMREVPWDQDGDFTEERLQARYNADLANDLGNLVSRTLTLVLKSFNADLSRPIELGSKAPLDEVSAAVRAYHDQMNVYAIDRALAECWKLVAGANLLIDLTQPWAMAKDPAKKDDLHQLFYVLLERIRWVGLMLMPIMPAKMAALLDTLGVEVGERLFSSAAKPGEFRSYRLQKPTPLFPRLNR